MAIGKDARGKRRGVYAPWLQNIFGVNDENSERPLNIVWLCIGIRAASIQLKQLNQHFDKMVMYF
jgi:hypothetical protein